jgi:hypothetical protein
LNWFNRRALNSSVLVGGVISCSNSSLGEISTSLRTYFLTWADETVYGGIDGEAISSASTGSGACSIYSYIDGVTYLAGGNYTSPGSGYGFSFSGHSSIMLTEGVHYTTVYGTEGGGYFDVQSTSNSFVIKG